jgi:hypothetical protein
MVFIKCIFKINYIFVNNKFTSEIMFIFRVEWGELVVQTANGGHQCPVSDSDTIQYIKIEVFIHLACLDFFLF